jgi:hypothetical protein
MRCRRCGNEWFRLDGGSAGLETTHHGAVTLGADGRVTGFFGVPTCVECGEQL